MAPSILAPLPSQSHSFTSFSLLPPELRGLIWQNCLPSTRIITISCSYATCLCSRCNMLAPPLALLYVNRESRSVALQRYEQYILQPLNIFTTLCRTNCPLHSQQSVWVDIKSDIFYFEAGLKETTELQICRAAGTRRHAGVGNEDSKEKSIAASHAPSGTVFSKDGMDKDVSITKVLRIALPYDSIYLNLESYKCGTGALIAMRAHEELLRDLSHYLEALPSLQEVLVVVDKKDGEAKKKKRKEIERLKILDFEESLHSSSDGKKSGGGVVSCGRVRNQEIEFIDFKASERFDPKECQEMKEMVMRALGHRQVMQRPSFENGLKVVELMHNEECIQVG